MEWNELARWKNPALAEQIKNAFKGNQYNLYADLCRAVIRGEFDGSLEELQLVAIGVIPVSRVGEVKLNLLSRWLEDLDPAAAAEIASALKWTILDPAAVAEGRTLLKENQQ